jgi:hypothetical protein
MNSDDGLSAIASLNNATAGGSGNAQSFLFTFIACSRHDHDGIGDIQARPDPAEPGSGDVVVGLPG